MDQALINTLFGLVIILCGGLAKLGYNSLMDRMKTDHAAVLERIRGVESDVNKFPDIYVRRDEFAAAINRIESATNRMEARQDVVLSRIEQRLDNKADKE